MNILMYHTVNNQDYECQDHFMSWKYNTILHSTTSPYVWIKLKITTAQFYMEVQWTSCTVYDSNVHLWDRVTDKKSVHTGSLVPRLLYCILLLYQFTLYMQETHEVQVKSSCELCSSRMQLRVVQLSSKRAMWYAEVAASKFSTVCAIGCRKCWLYSCWSFLRSYHQLLPVLGL